MEEPHTPADNGQLFVLDIGTRSIVGIVGHRQDDVFVVEASDIEPHTRRAMIDGQIEDIEQVARIAGQVKQRLEEKLGTTLTRVSVAAAGRALKTCRATATAELPAGVPITTQTAFGIENAAINKARAQLEEKGDDIPYYCVGHSVVRWLLDGYPFSTSIGHSASLAEVELIATFLPAEVVDSLRHCMELLDLTVDTLTLEPIAAMCAVIPQDLRLLNLALVDIGAGTSDIALSADSAVSGYTMATVAGDEVTETLIRQYLVDFATAERLKLALETDAPFVYTDILGHEREVQLEQLLNTIEPAVETLAGVIAEKITECNGGPPAAVFLVGGGSKTPGLPQKLAEKLHLPADRVALAGTNFSGKVLNEDAGLDGPEFATPVGIALVAADNAAVEGAAVRINGARVHLFTQSTTSLMDALLLGGYRYTDLMGRNGRALTFRLNGVRTVVRGGPYTTAELSVNGRPASLSSPVDDGDVIEIVPATSGEDATADIAAYAQGEAAIQVSLNGDALLAGLIARINGTVVPADAPILDGDDVEVYLVRTVAELCEAAGVETAGAIVTVNGEAAGVEHPMQDGDVIVCRPVDAEVPDEAEPAAEDTLTPGFAEDETPAQTTPPSHEVPTAEAADAVADAITASAPAAAESAAEVNAAASLPETGGEEATFAPLEPDPDITEAAPVEETATPAAPKAPAEPPITKAAPARPAPPPLPRPAAGSLRPDRPEESIPAAPAATDDIEHDVAPPTSSTETADTDAPASSTLKEATAASSAATPPQGAKEEGAVLSTAQSGALEEAKKEPVASSSPQASDAADAVDVNAASATEKVGASNENDEPATSQASASSGRSLRVDLNGKTVMLPPKPSGEPHRLLDMLPLVDIDPANPKGMVKVLINGQEAAYLEELVNGDRVEIGWETR